MADFLIFDDAKTETPKNKNKTGNSDNSLVTKLNNFLYSFQKINIKNKVVFYRLLATMVNAGVPLLKSVNILKEQERDVLLKRILETFSEELKE
ncbi:MAG: hypothetical protein LBC61_06545 [Candidatus Peribacteria bacterium]|jgi:type II secretory pathway component PulF|nr:hypothetical protein [Candidatus Peribacteria bacterium]